MDQANMLSIVGGLYDKLVADVSDAVIRKLKAENTAHATLEPETVTYLILKAFRDEPEVREVVRDIASDQIDNTRLSDNSEFDTLENQVNRLEERLDELEATPVDADNDDFQDAVRSVIRNHI